MRRILHYVRLTSWRSQENVTLLVDNTQNSALCTIVACASICSGFRSISDLVPLQAPRWALDAENWSIIFSALPSCGSKDTAQVSRHLVRSWQLGQAPALRSTLQYICQDRNGKSCQFRKAGRILPLKASQLF